VSAVEISNVTKTFQTVTAVDRLSLSIPEGSVYGFIGPNGSGKSTTMRMIANIFYPDSGTIRVFGQERVGTRSAEIGYLPEERGVYRKMRVRALLEFHGELRSGRSVTAEVNAWLERLGLADWADQKVETLSKGMSQKVQLIAAVPSARIPFAARFSTCGSAGAPSFSAPTIWARPKTCATQFS
jgi:ABC-2 type transport system ATP-binding protein